MLIDDEHKLTRTVLDNGRTLVVRGRAQGLLDALELIKWVCYADSVPDGMLPMKITLDRREDVDGDVYRVKVSFSRPPPKSKPVPGPGTVPGTRP